MGKSIQKGLKSGGKTTQCCVMHPITLFKCRLVDFLTITGDIKISPLAKPCSVKWSSILNTCNSSITEMKSLVPMRINVQTRQSNTIQQHATEVRECCMQEENRSVFYTCSTWLPQSVARRRKQKKSLYLQVMPWAVSAKDPGCASHRHQTLSPFCHEGELEASEWEECPC